MKKIILILLVILGFFFLAIPIAVKLMSGNYKDCERFVIDTYEVSTGINIPALIKADCYYSKDERIRTGIYQLDTTVTKLNEYLTKYNFSSVALQDSTLWTKDQLTNGNYDLPATNANAYIAKGQKKGNVWQCLLDKNTGQMWFQIQWGEER